ncbi:2-C-methyl-D-erythritol 4-phosphate cytidylyltransferase [Anaerococcus sp. NML200574]|uniref:2-C-methyl-D-erythritol 4-phosphate cytidylyltransferase n=1 Tax=Anaerococcus sp. NML200574 TaxID=2954486 RepID=UPI002237108A|nr:2-C-methyl-D-erythritol 4-phosphate cytidylyltransferase [Anaerococcus sp. NML200574]MCW6679234.1 2-C-methyl-D-erythritol 4-phosphate cytidylyltransferase [Anaerococcus sp. NML200574]
MYKGKYLSAIITAAGSGLRMGLATNKPYIEIAGKKILEITLEKVISLAEFDEIVLVIREEDRKMAASLVEKINDRRIKIVKGGKSREESTYKGLMVLNKKSQLVLTHDGVRPFASLELFRRTLKEMDNYKAAIAATKAKDTIKVANERGEVDFTPNRDFVYNIQTPQVFEVEKIKTLYEKYMTSEAKVTDDSQLFEFFDKKTPVKIVEGEYQNIKITTQEDIIFGEGFLRKEEK